MRLPRRAGEREDTSVCMFCLDNELISLPSMDFLLLHV